MLKDRFIEVTLPEINVLVVWWIIVTFGKKISVIGHSSLCSMTFHLLGTLRVIVAAIHLLGTLRVVGVAHIWLLPIVDAITALLLREAMLLLLVHVLAHVLAIALRARMHWAGLLSGSGSEVRGLLGSGLVVVRCSRHDE